MQNETLAGQYLTFMLKNQIYGVPISLVKEINRVTDITSVPQAPDYVAGVINLRGKIVPTIDLRRKFGMEPTEHTRSTCIIVLESQQGPVGVIVDSVSAVIDLTDSQIEPPPILGKDESSNYLIGMGKLENQVVILINILKSLKDGVFEHTKTEAA
jgi:purine-binding chemotaxis protein CheW